MKDMILGTVAAVACFFVLVTGFAMGKNSASADCKHFGAFREAGVTFDCKPRTHEATP